MVSRIPLSARTILSALALVLSLGAAHVPLVQARTPYKVTDRTEGDPGDGVLDPAVSSKSKDSPDGGPPTGSYALALPDGIRLVPLGLPVGLPGWNLVLILPGEWQAAPDGFLPSERRDRRAP